MTATRLSTVAALVCLVSSCTRDLPPPRSVDELIESPFLLEAAIVRCSLERAKTKYDAECINAREASNRLAAVDKKVRQEELEARSASKRKALRRTQQAATEARRRDAEARRQQQEDEYLGLSESTPFDGDGDPGPGAVIVSDLPAETENNDVLLGNQPGVAILPPESKHESEAGDETVPAPSDIDSIREELKRRQDASG